MQHTVGLYGYDEDAIHVVDMHTTGEATRIIIQGYPELKGTTLLEKRRDAKLRLDHLRRRLMFEPRGHRDMYGALLVRETEHVLDGTADIGVLFLHNEGYSTMCGHATLALGRFLVDTHDSTVFPGRKDLPYDSESQTSTVRIHAPCGVVTVTVPTTIKKIGGNDVHVSDPSRAVSFTSVPCYVSLLSYTLPIPQTHTWPHLEELGKSDIQISIAYGGAFYCLVEARELGFQDGLRTKGIELEDYDRATGKIKALIESDEEFCKRYLRHPDEPDLSFLYSVMVVDHDDPSADLSSSPPAEVGLCFFADQQVDRSPTGSCAGARVALRMAEGTMRMNEPRDFHSLVSLAKVGSGDALDRGAFRALGIEETKLSDGTSAVVVRLDGKAWYTGTSIFVAEKLDEIARNGFQLRLPNA